jgi:hypothetical protein
MIQECDQGREVIAGPWKILVPRDMESGIFWADQEFMEIYFLAQN